ncbi:MAG: peroxiredoxin [Myxococcaceae bacterium]
MVDSGQPAPAFTLKDASGKAWSLDTLHAKGPLVLFFYPRDDSPICTREVCAFRDAYEDFVAAGASVVGISSDSEESHRGFSQRQRLPFVLLSDPGGTTRKAYGVHRTLGLVDGRVTFVIDAAGIVRMAFSAQLQSVEHMEKALETVRRLKTETGASKTH